MSDKPPHAAAERFLRFLIIAAMPLLMLVFTLSTPDPAGDIKRLVLTWVAVLAGTSWAVSSLWFRIPFRRPPLFFLLLGGLLALYVVATVPSEFPWAGVQSLSRLLSLFTLYLVASQVFTREEHLRTFYTVSCAGMLAVAVYAFMQASDLDPIPWADKESDVYKDLPSTFGHPNFVAHALMFVIPMAVYLAATGRKWAWLLAAAFVIYLAATGQRTGWIALGGTATLLAVAEVFGRRFRNPVAGVAATLGGTAVVGVGGALAAAGYTILRSGVAFPIDESLLLRYQSYVSAPRMFFEKALLGHGPGVYGIKNPMYWTAFEQEWFAKERRFNGHVHNDLIEYGIDAGLFAAGIYLALLVTGVVFGLMLAFRAPTTERRRLGYLFAAIFAAFGIDGLFGFNSFVPVSGALFFLSMGMLDARWAHANPTTSTPTSWAMPLRWSLIALLPLVAVFESLQFSAQQDMHAGMGALNAQEHEVAQRYFERGLAKAPWDWNFHRQLGHAKASVGNVDGAIADYETLLIKNPYYILTRLPLAHARMRKAQGMMRGGAEQTTPALEELARAAADLDKALEVCPVLPEAHQLLGQIASVSAIVAQRRDGETPSDETKAYWQQAEARLEEAVKHKIEDAGELYRLLSQVRVALGDLPGAETALTEAVRKDPHDTSMWPPFLQFVLKFSRFDQARNVLSAQIRELEAEEPRDATALATTKLFLANILENGYKDNAGALNAYKQAAALEPQRPEIWTNFARFAFQHGQEQELKAAILQAVADRGEAARDTLPGAVLAVEVYLRLGNPGLLDASTVLLAAVRSYQTTPEGLDALGALGWAVDMVQDAVQPLPIADNCLTVFNIGLCRNALKQYDRARGALQVVDECIPQEQAAIYALHYADTLSGLKQYAEALGILEQAVNVYTDNLELRWAFARNLVQLGQGERAKGVYDQMLAETDLNFQGRKMLEAERAGLK